MRGTQGAPKKVLERWRMSLTLGRAGKGVPERGKGRVLGGRKKQEGTFARE
jgi:hypothetical protein